jgi:DNA mismatch endonuclease, patch repair protein
LHRSGLRYRLHQSKLPGKPDLVFPSRKTVLFVNGCFWHGHEGCKDFRIPKTRSDWWTEKIDKTIARDLNNIERLSKDDWHVEIIWVCEILPQTLSDLAERIKAR